MIGKLVVVLEQRGGCRFEAKREKLGVKCEVMPCDRDAVQGSIGDHESQRFLMNADTDEDAG